MPYIGKSPTGSGVRTRYYFTATGGETSISGSDDGGKTLSFTDGEYVDVYLNGIQLVAGTDYGTGTANTISALSALAADDILEVVVYDIFNVAKINSEAVRTRHYYTATGGETSITTSEITGLTFAAGADIEVKLNGITLVQGSDYNTTTANTVGGLSALSAGNVIEIVIYEKFQLADTVSKAQGGTFTGTVTADGGLNVGTIKDATGTTTAMTIDSSGRILTPARPAFRAFIPSNLSANLASESLVNFTSESFDIGSNYDNASGQSKFVAPMDGLYSFSANVRIDGATSGFAYLRFYKNGSALAVAALDITDSHGSTYHTFQIHELLELTSGDYIQIFGATPSDTSVTLYAEQSVFSGYLVG